MGGGGGVKGFDSTNSFRCLIGTSKSFTAVGILNKRQLSWKESEIKNSFTYVVRSLWTHRHPVQGRLLTWIGRSETQFEFRVVSPKLKRMRHQSGWHGSVNSRISLCSSSFTAAIFRTLNAASPSNPLPIKSVFLVAHR